MAATLALASPSREALVERWLRASRSHSVARLDSGPHAAALGNSTAPTDLRSLAQRELGIAGRYHLMQPPAVAASEPWWLRAWSWIADRWGRFWKALFGRVHVGKAQAAGIGDVLLVVIVVVLIVVLVRLLRNLQFARSTSRLHSEPLEESPAPSALYALACAAASRADYGGAALLLFAATIALLDRQGAVDGTSSATVGDLRRELRARNAALVVAFDTVSGPFVQKAYAERAVDEPQWDRARNAFVTLSGVEG